MVARAGLPWQNIFEVCVSVNADGTPDASRTEEAKDIFKPTPAAMGALGLGGIAPIAQGSQLATTPVSTTPVKKGTQAFSFFGGGNNQANTAQTGEAVDRAAALQAAQAEKQAEQ